MREDEAPSVKVNHGQEDNKKAPYPPGSTFFFKVKFDEPYLMYRDWREVTRSMLTTLGTGNKKRMSAKELENSVSRNKMRRPETRAYVKWIVPQMLEDAKQFKGFVKGQGIIKTRLRFLEWYAQNKKEVTVSEDESGEKVVEDQKGKTWMKAASDDDGKAVGKTIILPVAIPGCGMLIILYLCCISCSYF
jgi:tRNA ligase